MLHHETQTPPASFRNRLLTLKQIEYITSLKKSSIYCLIAAGRFPSAVNVSFRRRAWAESEVQAWIAARLSTRTTTEAAFVGEVR